MNNKQHYNIMTSCDEKLLKNMAILLYSLSRNLKDADTDFYLLHRNISDDKLELYYNFCDSLGNVKFHDIIMPDVEIYDEFATRGGGWCGEAYFSLGAHLVLPLEVERVLYLDAGDVIVMNDISEYYNQSFDGNALICTASRYKVVNNEYVPLTQEDLNDFKEGLPGILRGIFNSGSYVINLKQLRDAMIGMNDYIDLYNALRSICGDDNSKIYWGDQGFLSAAFAGSIKYHAYPDIKNALYMPYNFAIGYYGVTNVRPSYQPIIIHYAVALKPWLFEYPIFVERFQTREGLHNISELEFGQAEYYYLWHEYAILVDKMLSEIEQNTI